METCTPIGAFIRVGEVLPGQALRRLGWGAECFQQAEPGDRGQRQEGAWGAGQRGSGGHEGGTPGLQHRQGPRVPCLVREPGLPLPPPRPYQRRR